MPSREAALQLVTELQHRMVHAHGGLFDEVRWQRDGGTHGGGTRRTLAETARYDRASVNVSQIHYDDDPSKKLASATALSTIIHPRHPRAPSVHIHVSWTEMRDGNAYWRIMADLNPAIPDAAGTARFVAALRAAAGDIYEAAAAQGDRYFYIPALGRHRGVAHFYLEQYIASDDTLARRVAEAAIDTHAALVVAVDGTPTAEERAIQRAYHTLYLFQVLTLDRGTTSGLLVHDQNDIGILGSLPSHVDRALLASWRARVPAPVDALMDALLVALPTDHVDDEAKRHLAAAVRQFYTAHPEALALQARGDVLPPTVANHR